MLDPAVDGMKIVRYVDIFPWSKDPDEIVLQKREHVSDPKPTDCLRLRVEIVFNKKYFIAPGSVAAGTAKVDISETHDGVVRPAGDVEPPLKRQGR